MTTSTPVSLESALAGLEWLAAAGGAVVPVSGGRSFYVYAHGTTNQIPVYATDAMENEVVQPLTTHSEHRTAQGYVWSGQGIDVFDVTTSAVLSVGSGGSPSSIDGGSL